MSDVTVTREMPATGTVPAPGLWLDGFSRESLESGSLARLIARGVHGVSANPADALLLPDVRRTCDLLAASHEGSGGRSGFAAIDLTPFILPDSDAMVAAARRLHAAVARPNLLVQVPATPAGIGAIEELAFAGIGVNATLVFTPRQAAAVRAAHRRGLARRLQAGLSVQRIACIASMPVGALDAAVDAQLGTCGAHLRGKAGAACARLAWRDQQQDTGYAIFAAFGAVPQGLAFSGAGDDFIACAGLPGTLHVAGAGALESLPAAARTGASLQDDISQAMATVGQLARHGIDVETIGNDALATGLTQLEQAQRNLLALMG